MKITSILLILVIFISSCSLGGTSNENQLNQKLNLGLESQEKDFLLTSRENEENKLLEEQKKLEEEQKELELKKEEEQKNLELNKKYFLVSKDGTKILTKLNLFKIFGNSDISLKDKLVLNENSIYSSQLESNLKFLDGKFEKIKLKDSLNIKEKIKDFIIKTDENNKSNTLFGITPELIGGIEGLIGEENDENILYLKEDVFKFLEEKNFKLNDFKIETEKESFKKYDLLTISENNITYYFLGSDLDLNYLKLLSTNSYKFLTLTSGEFNYIIGVNFNNHFYNFGKDLQNSILLNTLLSLDNLDFFFFESINSKISYDDSTLKGILTNELKLYSGKENLKGEELNYNTFLLSNGNDGEKREYFTNLYINFFQKLKLIFLQKDVDDFLNTLFNQDSLEKEE